jgi:hypothetical protein
MPEVLRLQVGRSIENNVEPRSQSVPLLRDLQIDHWDRILEVCSGAQVGPFGVIEHNTLIEPMRML